MHDPCTMNRSCCLIGILVFDSVLHNVHVLSGVCPRAVAACPIESAILLTIDASALRSNFALCVQAINVRTYHALELMWQPLQA